MEMPGSHRSAQVGSIIQGKHDKIIRSKIVADALEFFDEDRYWQHCWVVMQNHVHCVVTMRPESTLEKLLHSWKSFTSHEILKQFPEAPNPFWQRDYFDRLVRDAGHFRNCIRYVRRNPSKARLGEGQFKIFESDYARQI